MLSKILSVTGRPGLYRLISTNKNMNIVESLVDGRRVPVYVQEKIVTLSDISIYTKSGDTPLRSVLKKIREKEKGQPVVLNKPSAEELYAYLEEVLPDYSRESVYPGDVKKLISWYNLLLKHNIDFEKADNAGESASGESGTGEEEK
ncbi:MAG: DUF5606 domain-containing protein [Proteiniphilum sp.]|jgi:hypothetical protein|nr:DUF5606 domain-containing protein [Proteiniphilum sp.]